MGTIERAASHPPYMQFVMKTSKLCNLRCTYCYEFPELHKRDRMTLDQLRRAFSTVAEWFAERPRRLDFVWHGGEPLIVDPDFYYELGEAQREAFEPVGLSFTNSVQTNLTLLDDRRVALLRDFFDEVGVSIDLFGDQRVNVGGRTVERRVLGNMQRLIDEQVHFGCIVVLSQLTAPHIDEIYRFFEDIGVSFRLLPIYRTGYEGQQAELALSDREIVAALERVVDRWFASDAYIRVEPIDGYVAHVLHHLGGGPNARRFYDKEHGEVVLIVDTDGSVYSNGDAYAPPLRHGNLFSDAPAALRSSPGFRRALEQSRSRVREACGDCHFHGSCSGFFVAESTPEQRWRDADGRLYCGQVRPLQRYVERKLAAAGLVDDASGRLDARLLHERAFAG